MDDDLFDLPDGWIFCKFDEILDIKGGNQPPKSEFSDRLLPGYIRLLQIRDFGSDRFAVYIKSNDKYPTCTVNDILIGRYGASVGKICTGKSGAYNVALAKVLFDDNHLIKGWVREFLRSDIFQDYLSLLSRSAQNGFNKNELSSIIVPLPPLNEQKRIVEKIESLRARSRAARKSIESIPTLIKQFRQSVLAAAFNGNLTKEWREQNSDVESAEVLLSRISEKLDRKLLNVNEIEVNTSYNIPDTWIWTRLKSFVQNIEAGKSFLCPEIPVEKDTVGLVKISAVTWGKFNSEETKTVSDRTKIDSRLFIQDDDFLISRANTLELVGASVIVDRIEHRIMLSDKVWRINFIEVNKRYVNFYLKSEIGRKEIESRATGNQLSMRNISQNNFKDIKIALSSIAEQEEIVNRIESLFSHIDRIEAHYKEIVQEIDRLDRSILHQAFTGRLVAQDPDDEPAKILLEKIQIDRDRTKNKVKS